MAYGQNVPSCDPLIPQAHPSLFGENPQQSGDLWIGFWSTVIGLLNGSLIMSQLNLFSLLSNLSVMVAFYATVEIFSKLLFRRSTLKTVPSLFCKDF